MPLLPAALLLACLAALAWYTRQDIAEYTAFKRLTETAERQRSYRRWTLKAFVLFAGGALVCLAGLGRLGAVLSLPPEFAPLAARARAALPLGEVGPILLGAVVGGMVGGAALAAVLAQRGAAKAPQIGDIDALMPRNGAESLWAAVISLNAGVSEELFFRLLLPLLLALLTGNVVAAFALAAIVFGLVHVYQGWAGVLATGFLGLVFGGFYLVTGSLLAAMAAHAILDLFGLVVRPTLVRMLRRR